MKGRKLRCRFHPKRAAVASGTTTKLGYCRKCWPVGYDLPPRVIPYDAVLWLAS
jgi:hypothetical protein